ncbi:hypothetical protein DZG01_20390 [Pseudomonas fluorescens]|nr:hypothetical protein DZG01_20390 [Pseudomonas fluorescens]
MIKDQKGAVRRWLNATSVARELAPAGLRSGPFFAVAAQPSGSKLPRHEVQCLASAQRFFDRLDHGRIIRRRAR